MVTGVVAACAALAICGLALVLVRRSRRDAEQRLAAVLGRIGTHLDAISASVEASISRVVEAQNDRLQPLTLDFDALVEEIVSEAAAARSLSARRTSRSSWPSAYDRRRRPTRTKSFRSMQHHLTR